MSITMNIHIQDGAVRIFGSDLELESASAVDKAAFDAIIGAISSAMRTPTIKSCNERIEIWNCGEEEWNDDEDLEEKNKEVNTEQDKEELRKMLGEMLGAVLGAAILSEFAGYGNKEEEVAKLKENFWQ